MSRRAVRGAGEACLRQGTGGRAFPAGLVHELKVHGKGREANAALSRLYRDAPANPDFSHAEMYGSPEPKKINSIQVFISTLPETSKVDRVSIPSPRLRGEGRVRGEPLRQRD